MKSFFKRMLTWNLADTAVTAVFLMIFFFSGILVPGVPLGVCLIVSFEASKEYYSKSYERFLVLPFLRCAFVAFSLEGLFQIIFWRLIFHYPFHWSFAQYYGVYIFAGLILMILGFCFGFVWKTPHVFSFKMKCKKAN